MKHKKPKASLSNKKKQKGVKKDNASTKETRSDSIGALIEAGEAAAAVDETDKALTFFVSAESLLKKEQSAGRLQDTSQLVYVLEKVGESKACLGDQEAAKQDFETAIALLTLSSSSNDDGDTAKEKTVQYQETLAGLHLYIGQLSSEHEALEAYKKGLQSLEVSLELRQKECKQLIAQSQENMEDNNNEEEESMEVESSTSKTTSEAQALVAEARQKLASARATVAELYLTDLCFEENAETECDSYVCLALKISDTDSEPMVDALQTAASLRLSQKRKMEAMGFILRAYGKMKTGCEALAKLVGLDDGKSKRSSELVEVDAASGLPTFEFRCQTVKLLLESAAPDAEDDSADQKPQAAGSEDQDRIKCYNAAIRVLGSLMAENDEVPEVWYLLGCAYMGSGNNELARHYWASALEMLSNFQKELEKESEEADMQDDEEDEELDMQLQSISCQMEDIRSKLEDIEGEEDNDNDTKAMEE